MKIAYAGVMQSEVGNYNGFGKAMASVCDEYEEIPMSNVNAGLQGLKQADIVFLQPQDTGISSETLQHLKNINSFTINWTGDARDITPLYCYDYARYVDLTCFSNMRDVRNMQAQGHKSCFLNIGYDPAIYFPDNSIEKIYDIVFFANNYGHFPLSGLRKQLVGELKQRYGDNFKAFGIGQPDGSFMGDQKGEADIYRRAKIGINLSHYDYERYTSDRMFRALGSGVAVLSHNYTGLSADFKNNEICIWNDIAELKRAIDYVLNDDFRREQFAKDGHQLALDKFTFQSMAQNIVELWKEHR